MSHAVVQPGWEHVESKSDQKMEDVKTLTIYRVFLLKDTAVVVHLQNAPIM